MIKDFLQSVAINIKKRMGNDLSRTIIIFPNKRAGVFFNDYLTVDSITPIWSPKYMSISEFFCSLSDMSLADPIDTICRLYKHYVNHTGNDESLDLFYGWGEQLLADYDDADKNLAPIKKLFGEIKAYADLESDEYLTEEQIMQLKRFAGDFKKEKLTEIRQSFQRLWCKAFEIYTDLNEDLAKDNLAYEGKLFRSVIEALHNGTISIPQEVDKVAFVGFNAIDKVEKELFAYLNTVNKALFYWDYDVWYTDDKDRNCEASLFIKENLKNFPNALSKDEETFNNFMINRENRSIEYVSSSSESAQAQGVAEWLNDCKNFSNGQARRTVIVLCNESLLEPTLHALPASVENVNVTKGFPLSHTPIYAHIVHILDEYNISYAKHVMESGQAKGVGNQENSELFRILLKDIQRKIVEKAKETEAITQKNELLKTLYTEAYYQAYTAINRFVPLIEENKLEVTLTTLTRLIKQVMRSLSIPFHGEPAIGLQVMGLLETRCLDFDNILMLSVNEGKLPQKATDTSFIPYLIRKMYGLSTPERRVSVYAYYFYRLIQRTKRLRLMYNNSTDGTSKGEMSRFMRALLIESNNELKINSLKQQCIPQQIILPKVGAESDLTEIKPLFTKLSPSALKVYVKCPLQFYFHYVKNLRLPQKQDTIINANDFGTVFHEAAQMLYTEILQQEEKCITPHAIKTFMENGGQVQIQNVTKRAFCNNNIDYSTITFQAITSYLIKLLEYEQGKYANKEAVTNGFCVVGAEEYTELELDIPFKDTMIKFKLYGDIDRRDIAIMPDGTECMRIIDYKTGKKGELSNYPIEAMFTDNKDVPENALQIFVYSLMCACKNEGEQTVKTRPIAPMLYYIPSLSTLKFTPYICIDNEPVTDFRKIAGKFKDKLIMLLAEIIDPHNNFKPTANNNHCKYCDYKILCNKE